MASIHAKGNLQELAPVLPRTMAAVGRRAMISARRAARSTAAVAEEEAAEVAWRSR
jgi:hypothetical protein